MALDSTAGSSLGLIQIMTTLSLVCLVFNLGIVSKLLLIRIAYIHCFEDTPIELSDITISRRRNGATTRISGQIKESDKNKFREDNSLSFNSEGESLSQRAKGSRKTIDSGKLNSEDSQSRVKLLNTSKGDKSYGKLKRGDSTNVNLLDSNSLFSE